MHTCAEALAVWCVAPIRPHQASNWLSARRPSTSPDRTLVPPIGRCAAANKRARERTARQARPPRDPERPHGTWHAHPRCGHRTPDGAPPTTLTPHIPPLLAAGGGGRAADAARRRAAVGRAAPPPRPRLSRRARLQPRGDVSRLGGASTRHGLRPLWSSCQEKVPHLERKIAGFSQKLGTQPSLCPSARPESARPREARETDNA
jgi:hypothetical protein